MLVSVIIPVYNGRSTLEHCLQALLATRYRNWECIVVDDGSTDNSVAIANRFNAQVITSTRPPQGPAVARNVGAHAARGDLLFFIDADVLVQPGTVGHAVATMQANPDLAACFGSYDRQPTATNFCSQYRNLQHHYVHQTSSSEASTFWSGCGMIKRAVFLKLGGFRTLTLGRPSIEDIDLGYRLRAAGGHIRLEKLLLVTHMKRWTLWQMVVTDIRDRAWPWTRLIVQAGFLPNDLNLQTTQRVSTAVAFLGVVALLGMVWQPLLLIVVIAAMLLLVWLNRPFYRFLHDVRGVAFALRALPLHWLYFLYSGATFALGLLTFTLLDWWRNLAPSPAA